ncbi:ribonuclease E/G [Brachybacterium avium]|uniref:Ribonuclease E n=1 Tax=Brachybacterium avium TaxID=2017485 RepID=A0A220U8X3_9MICO|nr:Rne/Rng family ribonuclease [Brachybacterium avium]ASK64744.1 ribonuclease E/G [Brachybacterium avium]
MADSTHDTENDSSQETQGPPPARRRRRAAGAPAGAPAFTPPTVAEPESTSPRTVVASQEAASVEPAPSTAKRPRRRAGAPAGAPAIAAEPAPAADEVEEPVAQVTDDAVEEPAQDAPVDLPEPEGNPVVDDLRALATARGAAAEEPTADDDRAGRREQVQMDFASLLFQAPTPQPRTTVAPQEHAEDADADAEESHPAVGEESSEEERTSRSRRSRSRSRRSSQRDEDATEGTEGTEEDEDDSADEDHSSSNSGANGSSRRRRRRGGRGRRGRGRGEDDGSESADGTDEAHDDSRDSGQDEDGSDSSGNDQDNGGDSSSGSSSSRRRRRRRRSGGGNDDSGSTDDPPNTVVKVREARDEVKAVKGSTRLEAKRQRRREGRDAGRRRNVITEAEFLARRESVKRSMVVRERPGRTQIAVLEDDVLVEHYVAQKSQTSMVGNVYLGKVQNVLPSMEAAFVDIGKGRNAVLYAGEVNWDAVGLEGQPRRIELALKSGDPVLVQVTKDPIGHKGARLTSQISLPGRYVVFVPGGSMTGISRKLPDTERTRLKKIMRQIIPEDAGVIVRTAAEGASEQELTHDVERLRAQWDKIQKAQKSRSAPVALSQEPDIAIKVVRDVFNEDFTSLIVEGGKVYDDVHAYVSEVAPDLLERVTKHVGEKDVFAKHRIDEQLLKAMDRKVYLPSGGSLVIDRTEAMTVVDVNTGKFTGSGGSLEETVTKNNLESAEEIVRQLRLRDIGGIIVIDFIDMVLESNRDLVLRRLVECLGRDRTKHQVAEVTSLGLVQMTRKRVGQGLVETFSTSCEHCHGRGLVVDAEGEHNHGGGNGAEDSSKSSRRRGRRPRNGAKDEGEGTEHGGEETGGDVHRLEDDESSRAQARATIASIAAASGGAAPLEEPGEGAATAWEQDAPEQG